MKIINLGRGQGKTTRLLYASEFFNSPILCSNIVEMKRLQEMAHEYGLHIPTPITVHEVVANKFRGEESIDNGVLIDEAPTVLQSLLSALGIGGGVRAITLTSDELNKDFMR